MLRALAGYFFRGAEEETPVECDTREVNDWLVVNMADRPVDDVDLDDGMDVEQMTLDSEYDDILDAVSCLMRTEELENDESLLDDNCSETDSLSWSKSDESLDEVDDSFSASTDFFPEESGLNLTDPFALFNMGFYLTPKDALPHEVVQNFHTDDPTYFVAQPDLSKATVRLEVCTGRPKGNFRYPSGIEGLLDYKKAVKVVRQSDALTVHGDRKDIASVIETSSGPDLEEFYLQNQKVEEIMQNIKDSIMKAAARDVTGHQVYRKAYNTDHHLALPLKTDLMQKIKELETEQQAKEHIIKKHVSRGQLNRLNKNYIYDSSAKKNRRKNLQRHPSGVSNNRKC